ncbi:hypothetical protein Pcinc_021886 [Petrolisthes cinctipes]|uniref:Integrase catalytic domain-containing protein n=1 Tax=Petrolisthes cinctipes TaxID=88211 RepID=A0AAE1FEQ3_PETCI|nr:hypothetical protein Pcinc_021886 [Petrolisthes cinctipes]
MTQDIQHYISTCSQCQKYTPLKIQAPEICPIKVKEPLELLGVDLIGGANLGGYCQTRDVNDELCKAYGIQRSVTSAYHPQTNRLAARTNRTLKTRLAKLCNTKMSDCPGYLEEVAYSMRAQKQKSTGFTPYHLMFGRRHRPIDQASCLSPCNESWEDGTEVDWSIQNPGHRL